MKQLLIIFIMAQFASLTFAQSKNDLDYILFYDQDTTYCIITMIARSGGNVYKVEYYDVNQELHKVKKKETKQIESMRVAGRTLDYIPLNASKPNKYQRHIERKIDGRIKIYDHIRLIAETDKDGYRQLYSVVGAGAEIYTIKLDNGRYYKIKSSNIKKYIAPYMKKCREFNNSFKDEITRQNIEEAVIEYNKLCY